MPLLQVLHDCFARWPLQCLPHLLPAAVVNQALTQVAQAQPLTHAHIAWQRV
jgi:hypothetical protein